MENNFKIKYAQQDLAKAQAIEDYVRKGIAKDLDGVIDDLTNIDENGNANLLFLNFQSNNKASPTTAIFTTYTRFVCISQRPIGLPSTDNPKR